MATAPSTVPLVPRPTSPFVAPQPGNSTPLYFFSTGQFLTRDKVTSILRLQLQRLGFASESFASHSFRIGAATTAAEAGLPPWLIQTLGRWSSNGYTQYIRTPTSILQAVPAQLGATHSTPLQAWVRAQDNVDRVKVELIFVNMYLAVFGG